MDENKAIEVTEEMIAAGQRVLWDSGILPFGTEGQSDESIVLTEIFVAMALVAAKPKTPSNHSEAPRKI